MNGQHQIAKRYAHAFLNNFPDQHRRFCRIKDAIYFLDEHDESFLMSKIPLSLIPDIKIQALEGYLIDRFSCRFFKKLIAVLVAQKKDHTCLMMC